MTQIALAWATKKRHIAADGQVLCEPKIKSSGYSVGNGQYNTLALSGVPTYPKTTNDARYTHGDGVIPFVALDHQPTICIAQSICKKCQAKYQGLLKEKK